MVAITSQGYQITQHGIQELDKRGIPHRGDEVIADGIQRLDFGNYEPDDFGGKPKPVEPVVKPVEPPKVVEPVVEEKPKSTPKPRTKSASKPALKLNFFKNERFH